MEPLKRENYSHAVWLSEVLRYQGKIEQADKLFAAYCNYSEEIKEDAVGGRNFEDYTEIMTDCLLYHEKYDEALPFFRNQMLKHNQRVFAYSIFETLPNITQAVQRPGYQEVKNAVLADLDDQRANVISYLKAGGEWQDEWDKEL